MGLGLVRVRREPRGGARGIAEGRCDRILPAARSFLDGFAEFCLRAGVLKAFSEAFRTTGRGAAFPCSSSATRWYTARCGTCRGCSRSRTPCSARPTYCGSWGSTRGRSMRASTQLRQGETVHGRAGADAFVRARPEDFLANQQAVLGNLWAYCPGQFQSGLWAMDSVHFRVPRGARAAHAGTGLQSVCAGRVAGQRGLAHAVDAGGAKRSRDHGGAEAGGSNGSGHRGR